MVESMKMSISLIWDYTNSDKKSNSHPIVWTTYNYSAICSVQNHVVETIIITKVKVRQRFLTFCILNSAKGMNIKNEHMCNNVNI